MSYNFSNVNIGTGPNTGDGDPLRVSFDKINYNFSLIDLANLVYTGNLANGQNTVTSVAGRNGNVILGTADIVGLKPFVDAEIIALTGGAGGNSNVVLATVAYTGNYNDLTHKPTLVSQFLNDAGYITSLAGYVTNTQLESNISNVMLYTNASVHSLQANLSTVAFTGNYTDLRNIPPDVDPSNISHFYNDVGYITSANIPTNVSYFHNDSGYITNANLGPYATTANVNAGLALKASITSLANVAFTGNYADLHGTPPLTGNISSLYNDVGYITEANLAPYATIVSLESVAFTGNYYDLHNIPPDPDLPIPANVSAFFNDVGYITSANIPTNVSYFVNDAGYITSTALAPYATTANVNADLALKANITSLANVAFTGNYSDLHGTPPLTGNISSLYNDVGYITEANLAPYATIVSLANVAFSGNYYDLHSIPPDVDPNVVIPANISYFYNDVGYITHSNLHTSLANVAFTGSYTDLVNTPNIAVTSEISISTPVRGATLIIPTFTAPVSTPITVATNSLKSVINTTISIPGEYLSNIPAPGQSTVFSGLTLAQTSPPGYSGSGANAQFDIILFNTNQPGSVTLPNSQIFPTVTVVNATLVLQNINGVDIGGQAFTAGDIISFPLALVGATGPYAAHSIGFMVTNGMLIDVTQPPASPLSWTSAIADTNTFFDPFQPTRLTVPTGIDKVQLKVIPRRQQVDIYKNGALIYDNSTLPAYEVSGSYIGQVVTRILDVVPGDYFEAYVYAATDAPPVTSTNMLFEIEALEGSALNTLVDLMLANVAFTGNYNDLGNKPTLVSTFTNDAGYLTSANLAPYATITSLANVAFTGNYADLNGTPPSGAAAGPITAIQFNNGGIFGGTANLTFDDSTNTLTIAPNSITGVATIAAPQQTQPTNLTIQGGNNPTGEGGDIVLQPGVGLTNGSVVLAGDIYTDGSLILQIAGSHIQFVDNTVQATAANAVVASTGNYSDLINKPVLANVATSGSYVDLSNKPTLLATAGPVTAIQVNSGSTLGGTANLTFDDSTHTLTIDADFNSATATITVPQQTQPTNLRILGGNNPGGQGGDITLQSGSGLTPGNVVVNSDMVIYGDIHANGFLLFDAANLHIRFSDGTAQGTAANVFAKAVPTTSIGQPGDVAGYVAYDASYFYYCIGAYDGTTNIWHRIANSGTTW